MANAVDVYQVVTDRIVAMLEKAEHGKWKMPWHCVDREAVGAFRVPYNVLGRPYNGINVWLLLAAKLDKGYASDIWATFQMWKGKGASVRKGEKATEIIFWNPVKIKETDPVTGKIVTKTIPMARFYNVFNANQVENYTRPAPPPELSEGERIANADAFFAAQPAIVHHYGQRAYYSQTSDSITVPEFKTFRDPAGYYGTLGHEFVHWTGHETRCAREFGKRFGDDAYAFEELVAELGAAYLCAHLEITNEPRADHAAYLASWIKRMKDDKRAIFTAASKAQKAVNYLIENQSTEMEMAA